MKKLKPEQNPNSPLNARFLVTISHGGRTYIAYQGNNHNRAVEIFNTNKWMTALQAGKKQRVGVVKPVLKLWDCRCTVKEGQYYTNYI